MSRPSPLTIFKEKNSIDDDAVIIKDSITVLGIPQESPPFVNTCQTNSFLSALRFSFFYEDNFVTNFKHRRQEPKLAEDALRVIGLHCREINVNASLVKMAFNTISKVIFYEKVSLVTSGLGSASHWKFLVLSSPSLSCKR